MATLRKKSKPTKTSKPSKKPVEVVVIEKTKSTPVTISSGFGFVFILFGFFFGYFLSKARATDYDTIVDMFMCKEFQLYGVLGVAILILAAGLFLTHRFGKPTLSGKALDWEPLKFEPNRLIGALLFGIGWALAGTCPGTAVTQLGEGKVSALFTVAGILAGVWLFQLWKPKNSSDSNC